MAALRLFARYAYVPTMILGLNGLAVISSLRGIPTPGSGFYSLPLSACRS